MAIRRHNIVVPSVMALALGLAACGNSSRQADGAPDSAARAVADASAAVKAGGRAVFPEMEYSFGTVEQDESVIHDFKVRNEGREVLRIEKVRGS